MRIFILLTLVPTLTFYVYVLVQFVKEAARRGNQGSCARIVPLHSENARRANYGVRESGTDPFQEFRISNAASAAPCSGKSLGADSERARVIVIRVKERLAAYSSGTGHLVVKRAAKG